MTLVERRLIGTTNSDGAATITDPEGGVIGKLYAVAWVDGSLVDNNTSVLSVINSDAATTLLTLGSGEGDSDDIKYPRVLVQDLEDTDLTGTAGGDRAMPVISGTLRLVIASGGDKKTGGCLVYIEV